LACGGDITDIITSVKFSVIQFRVLSHDTPNFHFLLRLSWLPLQQCKHYHITLISFLVVTKTVITLLMLQYSKHIADVAFIFLTSNNLDV